MFLNITVVQNSTYIVEKSYFESVIESFRDVSVIRLVFLDFLDVFKKFDSPCFLQENGFHGKFDTFLGWIDANYFDFYLIANFYMFLEFKISRLVRNI